MILYLRILELEEVLKVGRAIFGIGIRGQNPLMLKIPRLSKRYNLSEIN